jgi:predicted phage-related endonuclease
MIYLKPNSISQGKEVKLTGPRNDPHPQEWHDRRRRGIGGSDTACLFGMGFGGKGIYDLWLDKTGQSPPEVDNHFLNVICHFGQISEDFHASEIEKQLQSSYPNVKVISPEQSYYESETKKPFMATLDRILVFENGDRAILELKTSDTLPTRAKLAHVLQVQTYLMVTGISRGLISYAAGRNFRVFEIQRDESLINTILTAGREFWKHVESKTAPKDNRVNFNAPVIELPKQYKDLLRAHAEVRDEISTLKTHQEAIETLVKQALPNVKEARCGNFIVMEVESQRTTVNSKKLKIDFPQVYSQVSDKSSTTSLKFQEY